jgi:hypothetical protein
MTVLVLNIVARLFFRQTQPGETEPLDEPRSVATRAETTGANASLPVKISIQHLDFFTENSMR